jgi:uncharacterized membrane-anchored protein
MHRIWRFTAWLVGLFSLAAPARAEEQKPDVQWLKGPATAYLKNIAEVKVPEGYLFADQKGTQALLEKMGNPTGGNEIGFLAPESTAWFVVFQFNEVGFVKDEEKDQLDAGKMLEQIRRGTERSNERRAAMGAAPLFVTGWEQPPKYNPTTHNLEWAIRAESEGKPILNYNTRLLGRRGVMSVNLVIAPDKLQETLPAFRQLLADYSFQTGAKYAEFRPGDKIAAFGLAALVTGGAAAVAVKLGFFAVLAKFFKAFWKLVVVGVVALVAGFKRLFGGRAQS